MRYKLAPLEVEFTRMCRARGSEWIESVIRPLGLSGAVITVRDIPFPALSLIVRMFHTARRSTPEQKFSD